MTSTPATMTTSLSGQGPDAALPDGMNETVQNLTVTGLLTKSGGQIAAPITVTGTTLTLSAATHGGRNVVQDAAAGCTVTLPAATGSGVVFEIAVATTITSNGLIVNTAGTDVFAGGVLIAKTSDGTSFAGDSTANKTLTLNGTTTGGIAGSNLKFIDGKAGKWITSGYAPASGTIATPFSN